MGNCLETGAWIESKAACKTAAANLELSTNAEEISADGYRYPYGCYWRQKEVYWNPAGNKTSVDTGRVSVCATGVWTCKPMPVYLFLHPRVHIRVHTHLVCVTAPTGTCSVHGITGSSLQASASSTYYKKGASPAAPGKRAAWVVQVGVGAMARAYRSCELHAHGWRADDGAGRVCGTRPCPFLTKVLYIAAAAARTCVWLPRRCGGFLQNKGFQERRRRIHRLPVWVRVQRIPCSPVPLHALRTCVRIKGERPPRPMCALVHMARSIRGARSPLLCC